MERSRPAVLIAAGIGITPMLSMLRHVVQEGDRTRHRRPVWLFRSSRTASERAFDKEIGELVQRGDGSVRDIRVLSAPEARDEGHYDAAGRINIDLLKAHLPFGDYDFYLCGPPAFMQLVHDGLRGLNIGEGRIHAEAFGPSALKRGQDRGAAGEKPAHPAATQPAKVVFTRSAKEARWKPGGGTLLELAEERGLSPPYSCRAGNCGECRSRVVKGNVNYLFEPSYRVQEKEALICCSVPAEGEDLRLDI